MPDYTDQSAPQPGPKPSGGGAKVVLWVLVGLLIAFLLVIGCCGGIVAMPFIQIWRVESMVKTQVQPMEPVQEHLGTLTKFKVNWMDTARLGEGREGNWVAFDAEGDKGSGTVHALCDNENNQKVMEGRILLKDGTEIDLFE